jgi:ubiquinone/menaquinone biosynthesis C-methylase UbiE
VVTGRDVREIRTGFIFCAACGSRYAIVDGIVDLLGEPPEAIVREQQGWLKLLGETTPDLDAHMLQLPDLPDPHWQPQATNFHSLLEHIDLAGTRVLDIGSGRTWSARWLLRHGAAEVVAIDVLRQKYIGLETAELFFQADAIHFERVLCDMETLPFASAQFDAVFSTASLHHALDLRRAFGELGRVLRPGGLALIVNEPVHRCGSAHDLSNSPEVAVGINEHTYTIREWIAATRAAGLEVRLALPQSIRRAYRDGHLDKVLVSPRINYLPRLLGSSIGQRLLVWQPLLFKAYCDYELPLVMVARKHEHKKITLIILCIISTFL